jgi:hypothetical protein
MTEQLNIDLSNIGGNDDGSVNVKTGDELAGIINSAKFAESKAGNHMLKIAVNVLSAAATGVTVWHQFMLVNPSDKIQTAQWLARAKRDITAVLGYAPDAVNDDLLKQLAGSAFAFEVKVDVSPEYGEQLRINKILGPVSPEELEAVVGDFGYINEVNDIAVADDEVTPF